MQWIDSPDCLQKHSSAEQVLKPGIASSAVEWDITKGIAISIAFPLWQPCIASIPSENGLSPSVRACIARSDYIVDCEFD